MTDGNILYWHERENRHRCAIPEAAPLGSLGQCPECKRVHVVGWVDGGLAQVPGWKRLRWWHIPSQLRLRKRTRRKRKYQGLGGGQDD